MLSVDVTAFFHLQKPRFSVLNIPLTRVDVEEPEMIHKSKSRNQARTKTRLQTSRRKCRLISNSVTTLVADSPPFILYTHGSTTGFLDIRFEHHMRLAERSCTSNIGPYSAIPLPAGSYLRQSGPNPTIVPRILDSFYSFLEEKGILDQPFPVGIVHNLGRLQRNLLTTIICIEAIFGPSEGTGTLERGCLLPPNKSCS